MLSFYVSYFSCIDKTPALHKLVKRNDPTAILDYIKQNNNVDIKDEQGETALFKAATYGNIEIAKIMLLNGADINAKSNSNSTPLLKAILCSKEAMIKYLLAEGADINARDKFLGGVLTMPALRACGGPRTNMVSELQIMQLLVNSGADINQKNTVGETLLFMASAAPIGYMRFLLENGIDINAKNIYGETALFEPTLIGNEKAVLLLLQNGADPTVQSIFGETPITIAKTNNYAKLLEYFEKYNTDDLMKIKDKGAYK